MTAELTVQVVDQAVAIVLAEQLKAAFFNAVYLHGGEVKRE